MKPKAAAVWQTALIVFVLISLFLGYAIYPTWATSIVSFPTPSAGSKPYGVTIVRSGGGYEVWFTESRIEVSRIGCAFISSTGSLSTPTFYELARPINSEPWWITNDGTSIWFTEKNSAGTATDAIVRAPRTSSSTNCQLSGNFDVISLPSGARPTGIAAGLDSGVAKVYLVESLPSSSPKKIAELRGDNFALREWNMPIGNFVPINVAFESPTRVWFAVRHDTTVTASAIIRLDPSGTGTMRVYQGLPGRPWGVALDSFKNVWFTMDERNSLGRLDSVTGEIREFKPPFGTLQTPQGIAIDSLDNVWFTENGGNKISKLNTRAGFTFVQYFIPPLVAANSSPVGVGVAPDDFVWFAENTDTGSGIGRLVQGPPFGTITVTSITSATQTTTTLTSTSTVTTGLVSSNPISAQQPVTTTFTSTPASTSTTQFTETIIALLTVEFGTTTVPTATSFTSETTVGTTVTVGSTSVSLSVSTSSTTTTTTSTSTTLTTTTVVTTAFLTTPPSRVGPVPGFPWESILAGLLLGLVSIFILRRRARR